MVMNFSLSGVLTPLRKRNPSERSKYPQFLLGLFHAIIRPMDPKQRLIKFLDEEILSAEKTESRETLAAYIVGELVGDCDNVYEKLLENDSRVQRISDLAIDLEWSNGYDELDLQDMWRKLKNLIEELKNE